MGILRQGMVAVGIFQRSPRLLYNGGTTRNNNCIVSKENQTNECFLPVLSRSPHARRYRAMKKWLNTDVYVCTTESERFPRSACCVPPQRMMLGQRKLDERFFALKNAKCRSCSVNSCEKKETYPFFSHFPGGDSSKN